MTLESRKLPTIASLKELISPEMRRYEEKLTSILHQPLRMADIDWIVEQEYATSGNHADRHYWLLSKGIWDFVRDEFYPSLALIKTAPASPETTYHFHRDGGPIDLTINSNELLERVQITMVCDGQYSRLQNELLVLQGHATTTGEIFRTKGGIVERKMASDHKDSLDRAASQLIDVMVKKATRKYPSDMTLLVSINEWDHHIHQNADYDFVLAVAQGTASKIENFAKVYLTGIREPYFVRRIK